MNAEQETEYWDHIAKDSRRIEAEVYSDLNLTDCMDAIRPHIQPKGWVLDLGCGVGRLTAPFAAWYPDVHFVGVDSSPLMIHTAQIMTQDSGYDHPYTNLQFVLNNGRDLLPLAGQLFDSAYSMTMFQHIPHDAQQQYLKEIRQVLHRGGRFRLQFVFEGEEAPFSYPTPVKQMLAWCDEAGLRETDIGLGLVRPGWCWLTLVKL